VDDYLTDEQRARQVRDWLRDNGWYLLGGLVLGLGGLFGMRQWNAYTAGHEEAASALYSELVLAVRAERTTRAEEIAGRLVSEFGSTPYVDLARLSLAKMKLERSLPDEAATYLRQAADHTDSEEIAHVARLRLARVLASQEKYDEALKVLAVPKDSAFAQRYHEVRGDTYYLMGKLAEARTEYEAAIKGEQIGAVDPAFVQAKLDELAGAATGGTAAADPAAK
jgi:predicted negative regulator of RcsB-dependent stress response